MPDSPAPNTVPQEIVVRTWWRGAQERFGRQEPGMGRKGQEGPFSKQMITGPASLRGVLQGAMALPTFKDPIPVTIR